MQKGTLRLNNVSNNISFSIVGARPIVEMPVKGDIISMNLDGSSEQYRVLSIDGSIAKVMTMFDLPESRYTLSGYASNTSYDNNPGCAVNNTCNSFYEGMTTNAKAAILDTTLTQETWAWADRASQSSTEFTGTYAAVDDVTHRPYTEVYCVTKQSPEHPGVFTRKCYAVAVKDILDYLECSYSDTAATTKLTHTNIFRMFYNSDTSIGDKHIWLRDSSSQYEAYCKELNGRDGNIPELCYDHVLDNRACFSIDLSKVTFEKI